MKKSFSLVFVVLVIIFIVLFMRFKSLKDRNYEVMNFNSDYEIFNNDKINGLDITTVMHKAISNNDKYSVKKDSEGYYDLEDTDCVEIYVSMTVDDSGKTKTYRMESFNKVGMQSFIASFADASFKCTNVEYYKSTGKIKSMTFELLD